MDSYEPKEHSSNNQDVIYSWILAISLGFIMLLAAQTWGL